MDPREREENGIRFTTSLASVLKNVHKGELRISTNCLRLLSKFMERFNKRLLDSFSAHAAVSKSQPVFDMDAAYRAVNETIPGKNLQELARLEGQKQFHLYKCGIISYGKDVPRTPKKMRNNNNGRFSPFSYVPSVRSVYAHLLPENQISSSVEKTVADSIGLLSRKIALRCSDLAGGDAPITPSHLKQAIDEMLPSELAKHASAEALRFMVMFERGELITNVRTDDVVAQSVGS